MISYFNFKFDAPMGYNKLFPFLIIFYYSFVIFILSFCWVKIIQPADGYINPYFITTSPLIFSRIVFLVVSLRFILSTATHQSSLLSVCVFFLHRFRYASLSLSLYLSHVTYFFSTLPCSSICKLLLWSVVFVYWFVAFKVCVASCRMN
jgi:hypothetical protein